MNFIKYIIHTVFHSTYKSLEKYEDHFVQCDRCSECSIIDNMKHSPWCSVWGKCINKNI